MDTIGWGMLLVSVKRDTLMPGCAMPWQADLLIADWFDGAGESPLKWRFLALASIGRDVEEVVAGLPETWKGLPRALGVEPGAMCHESDITMSGALIITEARTAATAATDDDDDDDDTPLALPADDVPPYSESPPSP